MLYKLQFMVHVLIKGQTFENVGIHLEDPVFGHGQLYVAFSRATTRAGVKVNVIARNINMQSN